MYACTNPTLNLRCYAGCKGNNLLARHPILSRPVCGSASGRRGLHVVASSSGRWPAPDSYKLWPTELSIGAAAYNAIQGAELLAYGALIDAGFSGDWSRIGVLTPDQELLAQTVWWVILAAHSLVAAFTVQYAVKAGYPLLLAGFKGLLFGTLGYYDVYLRCEADQKQHEAERKQQQQQAKKNKKK